MSNTPFTDFADEVRPFIAGVPDDALVKAVRNAAIEFCDKSLWWVVEHDPITTQENVYTYDLDAPCEGRVIMIVQAFFENCPMFAKSEDQLFELYGHKWRSKEGDPRYYLHDRQPDMVVVPTPDERTANGITLKVAVTPTRASTEIDTDVYDRWAETIGYGARARLHEVPNQTYTDKAEAVRCWQMFRHGISLAKIERNRSLTRATQVLRPPRSAV